MNLLEKYQTEAQKLMSDFKFEAAEKLAIKIKNKIDAVAGIILLTLIYDQKAIQLKDSNERRRLHNQAIKLLNEALKIDPENPRIFATFGLIYHHKCGFGEKSACKEALSYHYKAKLLGLEPYEASINLANTYRRNNEYKKAENYYQIALRHADNNSRILAVLFNLTYMYFELKKVIKFKRTYQNYCKTYSINTRKSKLQKIAKNQLNQIFKQMNLLND